MVVVAVVVFEVVVAVAAGVIVAFVLCRPLYPNGHPRYSDPALLVFLFLWLLLLLLSSHETAVSTPIGIDKISRFHTDLFFFGTYLDVPILHANERWDVSISCSFLYRGGDGSGNASAAIHDITKAG